MWIKVSKLVVYFYLCSAVANAYYNKQDYLKQSERKFPKKYLSASSSDHSYNYDSSKVRQSRFPKIDEVKRRLDNMNSDDGSSGSKLPYSRIRHKGWNGHRLTSTTTTTTTTDEGLFDTYGDLENEDEFEEYDESLEDEEDELDYDDEDGGDPFFDSLEDDSFQAEEPTERPTIAPKSYSSLSRFKWDTLGTRAGVEKSRRQELSSRGAAREPGAVSAVFEHLDRVNHEGVCRLPLLRVIPVQVEHPDPSKTYTPHCTVLHRCAEDTGCCKHGHRCQFKARQTVYLYFSARILGSNEKKIEKLSFYNHTECECKEKTNSTSTENKLEEFTDSLYNNSSKAVTTEKNYSSELSYKSARIFPRTPQNIKRCHCPGRFKSKPRYNNRCFCDCEEENVDCIHMKKGKEHFSLIDRLCILEKECAVPICEYGTYIKEEGKCPSRKEKFEVFRRVNSRIDY